MVTWQEAPQLRAWRRPPSSHQAWIGHLEDELKNCSRKSDVAGSGCSDLREILGLGDKVSYAGDASSYSPPQFTPGLLAKLAKGPSPRQSRADMRL